MTLTVRQLQQFIAIAEQGSYRQAAEVLFTAQPALSVSMKRLEESVEAQLFERKARGIELTPAGFALLKHAREALYHIEQAKQSARLTARGELGRLCLGFIGSVTYKLLPQCIPVFRRLYPNVEVVLREDSTLGLVELLRAHEVDAVLIRGEWDLHDEFKAQVVQQDDFILAVPKDHPFAQYKNIDLARCADQSFLFYSSSAVPGLYALTKALCQGAGFEPIISQEAIQVQTLISLVASGMGVALVPSDASYYTTPHVSFVPLSNKQAQACLHLSLVTLRQKQLPVVDALAETLRQFGNK